MSSDTLRVKGTVELIMPNNQFKVKLENEKEVTAYASGKIRLNSIMLLVGDEVTVELSIYDLTKGRIVYRN